MTAGSQATWPTHRARFLIGRPGAAMARVLTPDDLQVTSDRIVAAYTQVGAPHPWTFHVICLRHDLRWSEQLVQIGAGQDACKVLSDAMDGMRYVNAELGSAA